MEVLRPGEGRRCYECQRSKKATKKRDTFVVPRWRGWGACRSRAPHKLRRACERSREERGKRSGRSER